jgi:Family of unknown function (DUF6982)
MDENVVVARFLDGRTVKGHTTDFDPNRREFHIVPAAAEPGEPRPVNIKDLKALFFVRSLKGDAQYRERKNFRPEDPNRGSKVEITFGDGEMLVGYTLVRDLWERTGFFVTPLDPRSNNRKVFVITTAVANIRFV